MSKIKFIDVEIYRDRFGDSFQRGGVEDERLFGCEYVHVQPVGLGGTSE